MKALLDNFQYIESEIHPPLKHKDGLVNKTKNLSYDLKIDHLLIKGEVNLFPLFFNEKQLCLPSQRELNIDFKNIDLTRPLFNTIEINNLHTNEQFSLEQALLTYLIRTEHQSLKEYLKTDDVKCLINDLFLENDNIHNKVIKYKIGRNSPKEDNNNIKEFIKNKNILRLDGNQMLNSSSLKEILKEIDLSYVDYIEEPFQSIDEWNSFINDSDDFKDLSFAIDENFKSYKYKLDQIHNLKAIIIKPTRDLSISGLFKLHQDISKQNHSYQIILSSSFDNEMTLNTLVFIAQLFNNRHGLGTFKYMKEDFKKMKYERDTQKLIGYPLIENIIN
ncbi:MAG: hypothetical protein CME69_09920 [Halobacteriovorax sp.]|nr:hypothetical protein [Halobacteriovorax sp.]